jgi:hypothetical protein
MSLTSIKLKPPFCIVIETQEVSKVGTTHVQISIETFEEVNTHTHTHIHTHTKQMFQCLCSSECVVEVRS